MLRRCLIRASLTGSLLCLSLQVSPSHAARTWWIPTGVGTIRGTFMEFNGYSTLGQAAWKEFATQQGFAMVGGGGPLIAPASPGYENKSYDSVDIFLQAMAQQSGHPEIVNAPLCTYGGSRGGWWALQVTDRKPSRAIGAVGGYCGMWRNNAGYPVTLPVNELDQTFFINKTVFQDMEEGFFPNRKNGALWSAAVVWGSHDHGVARMEDLMLPYFDRLIRLRVPDDQSTLDGPLTLNTIKESDGWLSNFYQSKSFMPPLAPYAQFTYPKEFACWFPDEYFAWVWRAFVSMTPLVSITAPARLTVLDGGTMQVRADPLSDTLKIARVEFYDGNVKLGEANAAPFTITACLSSGVHSLIAIATTQGPGAIRTCSKPSTVVVKRGTHNCASAQTLPVVRLRRSESPNAFPKILALPGRDQCGILDMSGRALMTAPYWAGQKRPSVAQGLYLPSRRQQSTSSRGVR